MPRVLVSLYVCSREEPYTLTCIPFAGRDVCSGLLLFYCTRRVQLPCLLFGTMCTAVCCACSFFPLKNNIDRSEIVLVCVHCCRCIIKRLRNNETDSYRRVRSITIEQTKINTITYIFLYIAAARTRFILIVRQ